MIRYSQITDKMPREFLLLQGTGCLWKHCTFCDYHLDVSQHPVNINREVLSQVTGRFGILDIINSGSCIELDEETLGIIRDVVAKKGIHTLWFEAHWMYRDKLAEFAGKFPGVTVKFRTGVETFDAQTRASWHKGIPSSVTACDISKYFQGACLLFGVLGQTKEMISMDIGLALANFEYFSLNAFIENSTSAKRDNLLIEWFVKEWSVKLADNKKVEVLLSNTDLGVGSE